MRFVFLHPSMTTRGGAENFVHWACNELSCRGIRVTLFTEIFPPPYANQCRYDVRLTGAHGPRVVTNAVFLLRLLLSAEYWQADLVISNNSPSNLIGAVAKLFSHKKTIWFCAEPKRRVYPELTELWAIKHGSAVKAPTWRDRAYRFVDAIITRMNDRIVCNSRNTEDKVRSIYAGYRRTTTCLLGVPYAFKPSTGVPLEGLTVSRLERIKNIEVIVRAAAKMALLRPGYHHLIAGSGSCRQALERLARDLGAPVSFLGYVTDEELEKCLERCSVVLYLPIDEPFGYPCLEALFFGKPIVTSNHGGPAEISKLAANAYLADPRDVDEIVKTTLRALDEFQPAMIQAEALDFFSMRAFGTRLLDALTSVLG